MPSNIRQLAGPSGCLAWKMWYSRIIVRRKCPQKQGKQIRAALALPIILRQLIVFSGMAIGKKFSFIDM